MDLAEIRKKARASAPEVDSASSVEKPAEHADVPVTRQADLPTPEPEQDIDPLEALFGPGSEINLVTEASFLHDEHDAREAATESRQWLSFVLGNEEYALDITDIIEIIKPREITDIPRVPEFILGVVSLRGVLITILDLKKRLHLGETELTPESRIIVCRQGERTAGLLVDSLTKVVSIPVENIEPPPAVLSGLDRELVSGVGRYQGRMMILLQLFSVLDAELV